MPGTLLYLWKRKLYLLILYINGYFDIKYLLNHLYYGIILINGMLLYWYMVVFMEKKIIFVDIIHQRMREIVFVDIESYIIVAVE